MELLRAVSMEPLTDGVRYELRIWDTGQSLGGKSRLAYEFKKVGSSGRGRVLFEGDDFYTGISTAIDSDDALRGLLGFLTLRPGDTDDEYFEGYSEAQLDFAESYAAEVLQLWASTDEEGGEGFDELDE